MTIFSVVLIFVIIFSCNSPTTSDNNENDNNGDNGGTGQLTAAHCELSSTSWTVESQGTAPYQTFRLHIYGVVENTGESVAGNVKLKYYVSGNCFTVNNTPGGSTNINGLSTKNIEGRTGWTNSAGADGGNCANGITNSDISFTLTWE